MGLLDRTDFCSLLVAVDDHYLNKLLNTFPTWVMLKPEILRMPQVFVFDQAQVRITDPRWGQLARSWDQAYAYHRDRGVKNLPSYGFRPSLVPWAMPGATSQRERMLTGLIRSVEAVRTPWYLKLDADTLAQAPGGWYYDKWFEGNPCYIAPPWSYTKPGGTVAQMNRWAATVPQLASYPDVEFKTVELAPGKTKDVHHRMASWTMFGNTQWCKMASGMCPGERLPFPSQDTYLSYIQARTGKNWVPVNFRKYGMEHVKNPRGLEQACKAALAKAGVL